MKNKKIIFVVILFVMIIVPIMTIACMRVLEIDDKGRVIIKSSMDHLVVEKDAPIVVAIQDDENMEINDEINKKEILKDKKKKERIKRWEKTEV